MSKQESDEIIGGTEYYDKAGRYLGKDGEGSDIRVTDPVFFEQKNTMGPFALRSQSTSINDCEYQTKYNIVNNLARGVGM